MPVATPRFHYTPPTPPPRPTPYTLPHSPSTPRSWRLLKSYLAPPGTRALLLYLLSLSLFLLYGKANFYRDPGSMFFDESRAYERSYSLWRGRQADMFWSAGMKAVEHVADGDGVGADTGVGGVGSQGGGDGTTGVARKVMPGFGGVLNPLSLGKAGPQPEVCVVFMTVERPGLERQYIEVGTYIQSRPVQTTSCMDPAFSQTLRCPETQPSTPLLASPVQTRTHIYHRPSTQVLLLTTS